MSMDECEFPECYCGDKPCSVMREKLLEACCDRVVRERDSSRALLNRARKFLGEFSPESDQNLLAEIAAALEMSGGVLLSEWQPIETAPKDGRAVLLTVYGLVLQPDEDTHCGIGRWQDDFWGNPSWCMDAGDFWPGATHWQPLPEPPR